MEIEDAIPELGRAYYIYTPNQRTTYTTNNRELNWPFPDKCSTNIGISVRSFTFTFTNSSDSLKKLIEPSQDLINKDRNTEQTSSAPTKNNFFPEQKVIENSIKSYKNIPMKYYKNEN